MRIELFKENDIVYLKDLSSNMKPICIDFTKYNILNKSLIKACGINNKNKIKVLDCTTGLVRDTFILANNNCSIIAIEKNNMIFELITNAIERTSKIDNIKNIVDKIEFLNMDSIEFLEKTELKFDCVYLDPMFENSKKTRLVKKEMQIFHNLTNNSDNEKLFFLAMKNTLNRVVIKRALHGPFLINTAKPTFQIKEKTIRFDIYLK